MSTWTRERFDEEIKETVGNVSAVVDVYRRALNDIWTDRDSLAAKTETQATVIREALGILHDIIGPERPDLVAAAAWVAETVRGLRQHVCPVPLRPSPTYRLPEWLGGHAVLAIVDEWIRNGTEYLLVDTTQGTCAVQRRSLVEVRPPSIDDPVRLPMELHYEHDTGRGNRSRSTSLWLKEDDAGWTLAQIYEFGPESYSAPVRLNAGQLRLLAQAAWQRANTVEGGAR